ncbi:DUF5776 domain-containing protein [Bacillus sp. 03113]|uniref:DUF5776 domain-containing protein n=1 Tax=Bacillus sp. 03113 TaxID=2578211 RepID=UPI00215C0B8A|nr:DUF5776 domain-containing protein [Bacillus sp. 03113]
MYAAANHPLPSQLDQPSQFHVGERITLQNHESTFRIRVKAASLWYYDRPDWNAKKATVKAGEIFTVIETLIVNGSKMYKLKSGNYITANPQYVERI